LAKRLGSIEAMLHYLEKAAEKNGRKRRRETISWPTSSAKANIAESTNDIYNGRVADQLSWTRRIHLRQS
jgi:hypothetical protein